MWDKFTDDAQGKFIVALMVLAIIALFFLIPMLLAY